MFSFFPPLNYSKLSDTFVDIFFAPKYVKFEDIIIKNRIDFSFPLKWNLSSFIIDFFLMKTFPGPSKINLKRKLRLHFLKDCLLL